MLDWINWQVAQSFIRNLLQWASGALVTAGYISGEESTQIQGIILSIIALAFSMISARTKKRALNVAKAVEMSRDFEVIKSPSTGKTVIQPVK